MRHKKHKYKIGSNPTHRQAIVKGLALDIINHGKVKTTHAKCKAVQPYLEKLITIAKNDSVANRRLVSSRLPKKDIVKKLFSDISPKYKERKGGYTRIVKLADGRVGDNAEMSYIMLV